MVEPGWYSMPEAADALGITAEAVRKRARLEKLRSQRDNQGRLQVYLSEDDLVARPAAGAAAERDALIASFRERIDDLKEQIESKDALVKALLDRGERDRDLAAKERSADRAATAARLEALTVELGRSIDRAETAAGDVGELRTTLDRLEERAAAATQDAEQLRDELERLQQAYAAALAQPWWRRLLRR